MIGNLLSINAARHSGALAVAFGRRRLTYAMLDQRACRLAAALRAEGVGRGDRVATLLHNCDQFFEILFGTAKIGAIFVPINFRLVAREVANLLQASTPRLLFAGEAFDEVLAALEGGPVRLPRVVRVDDRFPAAGAGGDYGDYEAWIGAHPPSEPEVAVGADEAQVLMHSSGTTGPPKAAVHTHSTVYASCVAKVIDFALTPADRTVVFGPLFHAGPLFDLSMPLLLRGGSVVVGPSRHFDPGQLLRAIAEAGGTAIPIYPTMLRRVIALEDTGGLDLSSLRLIITGGEPAPIPVLERVHAFFPNVAFVNNYGSTEGGPITTFLDPADSRRKLGSVGRPSFGVQVRIADEQGRALPPGEVGEILVRSPFVCRGYWNRPEATVEAMRNGWWHTGDLAWRDEEGFLWIAGRRKDMIKSGTENIYPIDVEQAIATLEGVVEVGVIGVPDEEWGETVAAYVVQAPGAGLDAAKVIEHCRRNLASYKKPRHVVFVDALPRNTTNKVAKSVLREMFAEQVRSPAP